MKDSSKKRMQAKMEKMKSRSSPKIEEEINDLTSENIIRLKLTTRKGTRIESVPLKKLEKLADKKRLYWRLEEGWLILYGL